ncbi:MAG TPA: glutamate 5-kinase [bacterium]|nr:glutamate 5-kinase [bacterium]
MSSSDRKILMAGVSRIVVKIGTSLSWDPVKGIDPRNLEALAAEIAQLRRKGLEIVMVASGAVGAGMHRLRLKQRPASIKEKQATAAVGQVYLMELVTKVFHRFGMDAGQILLSRADLESGPRYFNARNTLDTLLTMGAVPVINENDTVAVDELKFGDNDRLAALVCNLVKGDLLVILTDVDGLHTGDPRKDPKARRIPLVTKITASLESAAGGEGSLVGTGGMVTKLLAARMASANGEHVVIGKGSKRGVLTAILAGKDEGTLFPAPPTPRDQRMRWMPFSDPNKSELLIKAAAIARVKRRHTPLYPADISSVRGRFNAGDVIRLADVDARTWAKGICRYSSSDCQKVKGRELWQIEKTLGRIPNEELVSFEDMAFKREF